MSESNPYQAPGSHVADVAIAPDSRGFNPDGRAVDAGRGWEWIAEGFGLFKKQPGIWIAILIIFFVIILVLSLIPLLGSIAVMVLYPVFGAGLMLGCRALDQNSELAIEHLFAGFKHSTTNLVVLGLLAMVGWIAIMIPMIVIMGGGVLFGAMGGGGAASFAAFGMTFVLALLVTLALSIPLYMAIWFAPALIVLHDLKPVEAMKRSFFGCLKNIIPFLVYGVIVMVLSVLAAIPFGLGLLVLGPVVIASIYTAYRDIFFSA